MTTVLIALALTSIFPVMFIWEDYEKQKIDRKDNGGNRNV